MFRKAFNFVLLAFASPAWLLMRSRYGNLFLRHLFVAWAAITAFAVYVEHSAKRPEIAFEAPYWIDAWAKGASMIYLFSGVLWAYQAFFILLHRFAIRTGDASPPPPWYAGGFPLSRGRPGIINRFAVLLACLMIWMFWYNPLGSLEKGISLSLIPLTLSYILLNYWLSARDYILPYQIPDKRAQKLAKPRITQISPKGRKQDGLSEVFSRRNLALQAISRSR